MAITDSQLGDRRLYVGASDVGVILGHNKYKSPSALWREKRGMEKGFAGNLRTDIGSALERGVIELLAAQTGYVIKNVDEQDFIPKDAPFIRAHADGLIDDETILGKELIVAEAKTVNGFAFTKWEDEPYGCPTYYWTQLQTLMQATGADRGIIGVLIDVSDFKVLEFERDDEWWAEALPKIEAFWDAVQSGTEIEDESPARAEELSETMPQEGLVVSLDETVLEAQVQLEQVKKDIKDLNARKKELETKVKTAIGNADKAEFSDGTFITRKWNEPSKVEYLRRGYVTYSARKKPKK